MAPVPHTFIKFVFVYIPALSGKFYIIGLAKLMIVFNKMFFVGDLATTRI